MTTTPPTGGTPMEQGQRRPAGPVDVAATILLLVGHLATFLFSLLVSALMTMGEPCPPPGCYDDTQVDLAVVLTFPIAGLVFLTALVVAVVLMAQRRQAAVVPMLGCVVQVGLLFLAFVVKA